MGRREFVVLLWQRREFIVLLGAMAARPAAAHAQQPARLGAKPLMSECTTRSANIPQAS
jgi:hypothetical protein